MNSRNIRFEADEVIAAIFFEKNAGFDVDQTGTRVTYSGVEEFYKRSSDASALYPVYNDRVHFLHVKLNSAEPLMDVPLNLQPTVIIHNGTSLLCIFALEQAISSTNPYISQLGERFGVNPLDPIPLPSEEWALVLPSQYRQFSLEDLVTCLLPEDDAGLSASSEAHPKHFDADVITPYDASQYQQSITITEGRNKEARFWTPQTLPLTGFIDSLCKHNVGPKDGPSYVLADLVKGQRLKTAVKTCTAIGLDIDVGTPRNVVDDALVGLGCLAVRYSTHSNGKSGSEFRKDAVTAFAPDEEITSELMRRFVREKQKWDESVASTLELVRVEHVTQGVMVFTSHGPMPKHRIVVPMSNAFVIEAEGSSQKEAWNRWAKVPAALAALLDLPLDKSCTDPARLFYYPRHEDGTPFNVSLFGGPLLDRSKLTPLADPLEKIAELFGGGKSITPSGQALGKWASQTADGFEIVSVLEDHCPEKIRGSATTGKTIECPFDADHHNPGDETDTGCFAVNAADSLSGLFVVSCRHETCGRYTNLDMLGKMIDEGWFEREVIDDLHYDAIDRTNSALGTAEGSRASHSDTKSSASVTESDAVIFDDKDALVDAINKHYCIVKIGSNTRYIDETDSLLQFLQKQAVADWLAPYKYRIIGPMGGVKIASGFTTWLSSPRRRKYSQVVFQPGLEVPASHYNLWKGLAIKPSKGDWSLMRAHLYDVICDGNLENYLWLVAWLAQMLQEPANKPGTAVVIRSEGKGTGKSMFADWLREIFGLDHAVTMAQASHFLGNFNAHFERAVLAISEESFWAGGKDTEGVLKHLTTGKTHRIERKGLDSIEVSNFTHLLLLANNKWVVPATFDERRFFVLDVNESQKQNREYFAPIFAQAGNGGIAAMLFDLVRYDHSGVDLRNPPKTSGLVRQMYESMDRQDHWWNDALESGEFVDADGNDTEWPENSEVIIFRETLWNSYKAAMGQTRGILPSRNKMGTFLKSVLPGHDLDAPRSSDPGRPRQYCLPALKEARELHHTRTGITIQSVVEAPSSVHEAQLVKLVRYLDRCTALSLFDQDEELTAEDFPERGLKYD